MRAMWLVGVGAATGCAVGTGDDLDGGQVGEEAGAKCVVAAQTPLAGDEVGPGGFSPNEVLATIGAAWSGDLRWADGSVTALQLDPGPTGAARWLDQEVEEGTGDQAAIEPALYCPDVLEVDLALGFVTDDGAFVESFEVGAVAESAELATVTVPLEGLSGTFDLAAFAPEGSTFDEIRGWLDVDFVVGGPRGELSGQGSGTDGEMAYAESFEIGAFGVAAE